MADLTGWTLKSSSASAGVLTIGQPDGCQGLAKVQRECMCGRLQRSGFARKDACVLHQSCFHLRPAPGAMHRHSHSHASHAMSIPCPTPAAGNDLTLTPQTSTNPCGFPFPVSFQDSLVLADPSVSCIARHSTARIATVTHHCPRPHVHRPATCDER